MNIEQEALAFAERLGQLYYERRDMETLIGYMEEETSWIGTGPGETSRGLAEAGTALRRDCEELGSSFRIADTQLSAIPVSADACIVYGELRAAPEAESIELQNVRISLVCERTAKGMRLMHCHVSRPDCVQESGHYYVPRAVRADNDALRGTLETREKQLENLTINIPGGVHECQNDAMFSIIDMSDGFLSMFGYTREDVRERFDDKFLRMIHPEDRAQMYECTQKQLQNGPDIELEYRVLCKDGSAMWILDKGRLLDAAEDEKRFYCILIDITARKREQEALRLSLERHQVIMDQATDIIFEWDIAADTLSFSPNWRKKFGYEAISGDISQTIPLSENIHPEDIPAFVKIMRDTAMGTPYSEAEFRIKDSVERYYWCRIRATTQFGDNHKPVKAVGVIVDIDAEKKQKQALVEQAQRDALTGLYNKAATDSIVHRRMEEGYDCNGQQALMIIDVDHFKAVNDTYGHLCGDSLLSDVAAALRSNLRVSDVVGRIGGDEFLVYLPFVSDEESARAKADAVLDALHMLTPETAAAPVTCSIGVAVAQRGSIDYYTLYHAADQALYYRKNAGRGGVSLYDPALCGGETPCPPGLSAVGVDIGSDESNVSNDQLAQYTFRTLLESPSSTRTINRLLEIIGRSFDVSRVYIFESSEDGERGSIAFEWCSEGISPQMDLLKDMSYKDDLGDYLKNFDESGVFYCPDVELVRPMLREVLAQQGIYSMLQCAAMDDGKIVGGVGFDECREKRVWSAAQIASFKLTAGVLSTFLIRMQLKRQLRALQ